MTPRLNLRPSSKQQLVAEVAHGVVLMTAVAFVAAGAYLASAVSGCVSVPSDKPPAPAPTAPIPPLPDSGAYPDDEPGASDGCIRAARRLWALGCASNVRRVNGATWPAFCREREALIATECIAAAPSPDGLPACRVTCHPAAPQSP